MGMTDTYSKVIEIISESLDIDVEDLNEDTQFSELGADSFDMLEMVTAIGDAFDVEVADASIEDFHTIGDIVEALNED